MKILRSTLSTLIYLCGRAVNHRPAGVRILCYHHVRDNVNDYLSVSTSQFKAQMDYLAQSGYRTIKISDLVDGKTFDKDLVVTFDDGYEDNFTHAFPAMSKHGFYGTVFCTSEGIGKPGYLSKAQIHEMKKAGFEFGSHTKTHAELPRLNHNEKMKEIAESKTDLETNLGMKIEYFCYPRGLHDEESVRFVKEAGYIAACCNAPGSNNGTVNPFLLKRTEIAPHDSLFDFKKKLAGAYDFLHSLLHQMRGRP